MQHLRPDGRRDCQNLWRNDLRSKEILFIVFDKGCAQLSISKTAMPNDPFQEGKIRRKATNLDEDG